MNAITCGSIFSVHTNLLFMTPNSQNPKTELFSNLSSKYLDSYLQLVGSALLFTFHKSRFSFHLLFKVPFHLNPLLETYFWVNLLYLIAPLCFGSCASSPTILLSNLQSTRDFILYSSLPATPNATSLTEVLGFQTPFWPALARLRYVFLKMSPFGVWRLNRFQDFIVFASFVDLRFSLESPAL